MQSNRGNQGNRENRGSREIDSKRKKGDAITSRFHITFEVGWEEGEHHAITHQLTHYGLMYIPHDGVGISVEART